MIAEIGGFVEDLKTEHKIRKSRDLMYNIEDSMAGNREYLSFLDTFKD